MATFRSNLNSVPNTNSLSTFGERLTTCFQQLWRHSDKNGQQHKIIIQKSKSNQKQQRKEKRFLYNLILTTASSATTTRSAEHSSLFVAAGKNKLFKDFNTKILKIFKRKKSSESKTSEQPTAQIIGTLFSSTLIAAAAATETVTQEGVVGTQQQQRHHHQQFSAVFSETEIMTIAENTFCAVRYENPDIDNEIRAILTANAQNGSTIAQIKEEYRKQTGSSFPIYGNITDFLLTIPRVTAECNDNGTIFFNIKPSEKTKHIYDMVVTQNNRKMSSNSSSGSNNSNYVPNWRQNSHKPLQRMVTVEEQPRIIEPRRVLNNHHSNHVYFSNVHKNHSSNNSNLNGVLSMAMAAAHRSEDQTQKQWKRPLTPCRPRVKTSIQTPAILEQSNWFFEDNLNYLNNRFKGGVVNGGSHVNFVAEPMPAALPAHHPELEFRPPPPPPQQRMVPTVEHILGRPSAASSEVHSQQAANKEHYVTASSGSLSPRSSSQMTSNESLYTDNSDYNARILDFPLLGDDFFLYMARMELKCKFKKYEKILQSGLCVSGQTVIAAMRRLRQINPPQNTTIIVNIGSVDIMQGRPLVQIEHDFRQLIALMHSMCLTPVLTTLAPLANHAHDQVIKEKLLRFNEFIKREGQFLTVIDIFMCLVNEYGTLRFDCYQSQPRTVTGSKMAHVFWNKIGRQRVLQLIEANLEY